MPKKKETNTQFVTRIMERSNSGALAQAFVIEALTRYVNEVTALTDKQIEKANQQSPGFNMYAWRETAKEIKQELDYKFGGY